MRFHCCRLCCVPTNPTFYFYHYVYYFIHLFVKCAKNRMKKLWYSKLKKRVLIHLFVCCSIRSSAFWSVCLFSKNLISSGNGVHLRNPLRFDFFCYSQWKFKSNWIKFQYYSHRQHQTSAHWANSVYCIMADAVSCLSIQIVYYRHFHFITTVDWITECLRCIIHTQSNIH